MDELTSLFRRFGEAAFADHGDFDFAGISQLLFEGLGDVAADFGGRFVGRVVRVLAITRTSRPAWMANACSTPSKPVAIVSSSCIRLM